MKNWIKSLINLCCYPYQLYKNHKDTIKAVSWLSLSSEMIRRKEPTGEYTSLIYAHAHMVSGRAILVSYGHFSTVWRIPDGLITVQKEVRPMVIFPYNFTKPGKTHTEFMESIYPAKPEIGSKPHKLLPKLPQSKIPTKPTPIITK